MADQVWFFADPLCPWCYQTSRWMRRLADLGEVDIHWGVFSLELNGYLNRADGTTRDPVRFEPGRARSAAALRTMVHLRATEGDAAVGAFYWALTDRYFHDLADLADPAVIAGALEAAGLAATRADEAQADPATWDAVRDEHLALVASTKAFGVPTIRLDAADGPAMFGPVIANPPADDDGTRELWTHTRWFIRNPNVTELKRGERVLQPDLAYWRKWLADRAAERAALAATEKG
jgi:predicted DsbA family dithiol-disulfide isomerase